jgi:hypothetical protein
VVLKSEGADGTVFLFRHLLSSLSSEKMRQDVSVIFVVITVSHLLPSIIGCGPCLITLVVQVLC